MGERGFNRQWARAFDSAWCQSAGRSPWSEWIDGPWGKGGGPHGGHGGPGGGRHQGPPPWVAGLLGLTVGQQPQQRGPRVRRGDVRSAILDVLRAAGEREEAVNGYQVIQQIAERSNDAWRPSPGSVYPTIQQLEDEGLVEGDDTRGRRALRLTDEGRTYVAEHAAELASVWRPFDGGAAEREAAGVGGVSFDKDQTEGERQASVDLRGEIGQVMSAVWQIVSSGSQRQRRAAVEVLVEARRKLYGILADGHDGPGSREVTADEADIDPDMDADPDLEEDDGTGPEGRP